MSDKSKIPVYPFSSEKKDDYCLAPLSPELKKLFSKVESIQYEHISDEMMNFSTDRCPVGIFSSLAAYSVAKFIRGGRPFVAIGVEHGVAPFKFYTHDARFMEYDCYISPTRMWADRLASLYPRYASKFANVAYPRLDDLKLRMERRNRSVHEGWNGAPAAKRDLVVFSWGVDHSALGRIADREGVVYLVHPAMSQFLDRIKLKRARVVLSTPDVAATLIAQASRIFGDFSSLTLEAACLNPKTYMFIDRTFYRSDCDLAPEFYDRGSEDFGRVTNTVFKLPEPHILTGDGLARALGGNPVDDAAAVLSWAPAEMLPEATGDQAARAASVIAEAVAVSWPHKNRLGIMSPNLAALKAVDGAYREVLGRKPDYPHALQHAQEWINDPAPFQVKTLGLYKAFADSPEGRRRWAAGIYLPPQVAIETLLGPDGPDPKS